ncbi:glycosyltransferase family 2 protein [Candidatus Poribacteria bacterium]|jgi:glycosyltransferase involved in cell wall biosynthesis|nr:glycosyltransferase family 2 protein [Candidatus Poribacteria bacterium]MBT5535971.1 glycosyltransferase family 2 protein [Candidatus Poribacteria bacterium]MBT5713917.1 glycosyltransferase family 2 protein [Candidatus Poribacteria bacterium]MBT7095753.1 glycosyltransferase family 2 protein [Candidatus Poribacteria bacterium]MBT7808733.1 glycosyltransferase family 2 protein [Candidatus Poribacteria bacterium]
MTQPGTRPFVSAVIPAYNEEHGVGRVLGDLPDSVVDEVIVVDNGSTDRTACVAREHGARLASEHRRGYGQACLAGIRALNPAADIVVFLDADYSDDPHELPSLLTPILDGQADLVIGSRTLGRREKGALAPQARFGNRLATSLISRIWGVAFTDLGPFRAVRRETLRSMDMRDTNYGWTVEMQVKAAILRVKTVEVPVSYRRRIGKSKITGTIRGTLGAGMKILATICYYWVGGGHVAGRHAATSRARHKREPIT